MAHQRQLLLNKNRIEHKHKFAWLLSFSLPNPCFKPNRNIFRYKTLKRNESEFVISFLGINFTIIFTQNASLCYQISATKTVNKSNLQNVLSKSLPTLCTLIEKLSYHYDYFLNPSGFSDFFGN